MIYLSAAFFILVGLPCMALCHKVVAERMDEYESKLLETREDRCSIGSCSQRSTSMSARLPPSLHVPNETDVEPTPEDDETRPALASIDLNRSNHHGSALSSLFEFSAHSEVVPIDAENEPSMDTWMNYTCSYFFQTCHRLKLVSLEDL